MYHAYFGIDEQAFSIAVNPRYMYMSTQHKEALAHLLYGVNSGGFVMLTGEVGTGKTTIIRCLLEQLPDTADLAIVLNPSANSRDLICSICDEFKIDYDRAEKSVKVLTDTLTQFLIANHQQGHKSIVLIDEAQLLRVSTLEQVRLLTNLETNTQKLLQIILVGQPELNDLLAKPDLRQLSQRITARYHLRPLSEKETEAYIKHRLNVAGLPPGRQPFSAKIFRRIYQITYGIPRLINVLCDRMLLGAYSRDTTQIDANICKQAALEVLGDIPHIKPQSNTAWMMVAGSSIAAALLVAVVAWLWWGQPPSLEAPQVTTAPVPTTIESPAPASQQSPAPTASSPQTPKPTQPEKPEAAQYWVYNAEAALRAIADAQGILTIGQKALCEQLEAMNWDCATEQVATWGHLSALNRVGVMSIVTPSRERAFVSLMGLSNDTAWVLHGTEVHPVPIQSLGKLWDGEFTYYWRKPAGFSEPIGRGDRGPMVQWLAEQFAVLDQQSAPLATTVFNRALQTRVKLFQQTHGLEDDGFVGQNTLLKLNEALGLETTLSEYTPAKIANSAQE